MANATPSAPQSLQVYPAAQFRVTDGVAEGDPITFADDLVMDDLYQLVDGARRAPLIVTMTDAPTHFILHPDTPHGAVGNDFYLDCCVTLMAPDSTTIEALIFVEVEDGEVAESYFLPLATLAPGTDYRLVGVDRHAATSRFAEVACVSFTRGTRITLASGEQRPVEDLQVGDRVLTRDDGPQDVRWIGQTTLRAVGAFAPVVIRKDTLFNAHDLVLSPDHRIFVYQREDALGAGRAEVLIKVRHLINGDTVFQRDGGFVDYFQLLFDDHQIVYAEGIAAESLLIDPRTRGALPEGAPNDSHRDRQHNDYEVTESLLSARDAVALLRRASSS
ncbi:Hint domain-containing protein [Octadecabacter sp. SW4]|uniref:Hint domain-containing protein n=1 Tax=Octadecabacter sp. SW4 TaxID=2602067 RepID=UPI0011C1DC93|nr:Hint domain-containing protein [Octadecabacter sp. SW4]QEE35978.1 Hint domain-containing protein [Octadecabacter sp. SW4]